MSCWRLPLLCAPAATACETEVARLVQEGELPAPTGLSLNKDDTIRETTTIAEIAQEHARWMLWRVLMGETLTEREIADDIDRVMIENGSNPDWPAFGTIVASGANGAIRMGTLNITAQARRSSNLAMSSSSTWARGWMIG